MSNHSSAKTLVISYVGMKTQEVRVASTVNVFLQTSALALDEVIVTALGVKRSEKALGFSATTVNNETITETRTSDIMSSLAGKVAGVQISATSSDPGASNSVVIRGFSSLSGTNQPLYVIDGVPMNNASTYTSDPLNSSYDFGNGVNAVNPDDVESMTILKGAAATALYGSRASGGVILITTKSGQINKKGMGIEYNGGVQFQRVVRLPELQNEFGIGWSGDFTMIENGSWGPRFDGSKILWGNVYNNSQKMQSFVPQKDNIKDFFDTGLRYSNSLSFNGATDVSNYFVSFSQISDDGMLPTNADLYEKYTFSARGSHKIGNLTFSSSINYASQRNKFATTGQGFSMINSLYQTPRNISIIGLENLDDPFNTPGYYYTPYGVTNPYYILNTYENSYKSEKIFGKFEANYNFLQFFNATYRIGLDSSNGLQRYGEPNFASLFQGTPNYGPASLSSKTGEVSLKEIKRRDINQDFLIDFSMPSIGEFGINAFVGSSMEERKYFHMDASVTGLDLPTWYNLSNSANTPVVEEHSWRRRIIGVFGQAELSWRNMIYLTISARNDWSSTLPSQNRSFFYPGITGSFIFSELVPEYDWLTFGKLRLAYGKTGNDATPYRVSTTYEQAEANGSGFGNITFPLNGINAFTLKNALGNPDLQPEITTEYEIGLNAAFLKGRISFDVAYYNRTSDKQVFALNTDAASGFTSRYVNIGEIENKGVELLVNLTPVKLRDFSWDVSWNFSKNNSKVLSLPEDLGGTALLWGLTGGIGIYAIVGEPVGAFMSEVPLYDDQGRIVVNESTGLPVEGNTEIVGSINHDYEMGVTTAFKYKGISLDVGVDIRKGGLMYSRTKSINYFTGNAIQTTYNDRNTFIVPNSVNGTVQTDANDKKTVTDVKENTTPISSDNIYMFWDNGAWDRSSSDLIDKSYVKLRSIVLGWDLPKVWLNKTFLEAVKVSLYGNNLFVWTPSSNTFIDPEMTSNGNDLYGKWGEYTTNPSSRRFGFNVMVKF